MAESIQNQSSVRQQQVGHNQPRQQSRSLEQSRPLGGTHNTTQHNTRTQVKVTVRSFVRSFVHRFHEPTTTAHQRKQPHTTADDTALPHAATVLTLYYAVLSFQCRRQPLLAVDRRSLTTERSNRRIVCSNCVTHCMLRSLLALRRCR